jgi:signal transduction histidine kinase
MFDKTIPFHQSLRARLLAALALVALISVIGLGLAAYFNERAALEAQVTAQLTSVADLKKEQIITWLNERQADVRLLAVNKLNQEHFTEILSPDIPARRKAEFAAFLADNLIGLQQSRAGYSQIVMVDTDGTIVIATDPALVGQSITGNPTFAATIAAPDREFIQDIHFDPDNGRFEMAFGRVMYAVDPATLEELPQVIGVVIITVNMDETIYPLIHAWPGMGRTGETLLIRTDGDNTLFLNNLRFDGDAALRLSVPADSTNARPAHLAARGHEGIIQTPDYRGAPVLAAYRHIPGIGWGFVAKEDLDEAFAPVNALAGRIGLIAAGVLLAATLVSLAMSRTLTRPLAQLVEATQAIAAGDWRTEIPVMQRDEIGALAGSFQAMVVSLEQRQQQVEAANQATRRINVELKTTSAILRILNATSDVVEAFPAIAADLRPTVNSLSLALLDEPQEKLILVATSQSRPTLSQGYTLKVVDTASGSDLLAGHAHLTPDLAAEVTYPVEQQLYQIGYRSQVSLPLRAGERVIGALNLSWLKPAGYDMADLSLFNQIADAIALALERNRLFDEARHHSAELSALHELSLAVSSSLEPTQVLRMAAERIVQLLGAAAVGLFLTTEAGTLRPGALKSPEWPVSDEHHLATANLLWQRLRASGETSQFVNLAELVECEAYPPACDLQQAGVRRIHLTPLAHANEVLGMLSILWFRAEVTTAEVQLAQTMAQIVSPAIAHAQSFYQTYEQLRQTNQRLSLINQISNRLSAILDLDQLLAEVAQLMRGQLGYDRVRVGLIEGDEVVLQMTAVGQHQLPELRFQLGQQSIGDWAAIYGQALLSMNGGQNGRQEATIRSELAAPICLAERTLGVLLVGSQTRPGFGEADQALLQAIAGQLALALENARTYGQVRQQAEALTQANTELARVTQAKTDFINGLSHELRSPLTAIIGFAEILQTEHTGPLNETQAHYAQTIWRSSQHLVRLVNEALDLAKIEAGKVELFLESVTVADLFNDVASMLAKQAEDKRIQLKTDLADPRLQLKADLTRLRQILINLLSNAIKFTPAGGEVVLRAAGQGEAEVLLSVTDTGIGLKPEDFPKIFGQFEQIDNGLTCSEMGTGLGLVVTKQLVELHGGRIWFESTYGTGTTFFVALPASEYLESVIPSRA